MDRFQTMFNAVNAKPYEGFTVRLFNPKTRLWSFYCRQFALRVATRASQRPLPGGGSKARDSPSFGHNTLQPGMIRSALSRSNTLKNDAGVGW